MPPQQGMQFLLGFLLQSPCELTIFSHRSWVPTFTSNNPHLVVGEHNSVYFACNETKLPFIVCWLCLTLHISSQHHRAGPQQSPANIHIVSHPYSKEYLRPDWFQESEKDRAMLGGFWPLWPYRAQISFVSLSGLMLRILPASEKPVLLSLFSDGKFKLWARNTCGNRLSYDFGVEIYHLLCLSFIGPLIQSWICIWEFKTFLFTTAGSPIATFFRGGFIWPLRGTF